MSKSIDLAILTPTPVEYDMMRRELAGARDVDEIRWPTQVGKIGRHRVGVFLSGKGEEATASAVALIAHLFEPRWVLLVGVAGGVRKLRRGDLIVANVVQSIDFGKVAAGGFRRRPELDWPADRALLARAAVLAEGVERPWVNAIKEPRPDGQSAIAPNSVVGYVGSSNKVVDDVEYPVIVDALRTATEIDAFEMEGVGAAIGVETERAIRNVGLLMVRGISDQPHDPQSADGGSEQRAKWKRYAAHVAAVFTRHLIEHLPRPRSGSVQRQRSRPSGSVSRRRTALNLTASLERALVQLQAPSWVVRRAVFDEIVEHVRDSTFPTTVVQGLPDIGKTSALFAVARELRAEFEYMLAIRCDSRASLELLYVLEPMNELLASVGRPVAAHMLQFRPAEEVRTLLIQRLLDLSCLLLIDNIHHLPESWQKALLLELSHGPKLRVVATTERQPPSVPAHRVVIPPLETHEQAPFIAEALRAYGLDLPVSTVIARLPEAVRSQPSVVLPLIAQLRDVPLELWPINPIAVQPVQAVERLVADLPVIAQRTLATVVPLAGIEIARALQYLRLPDHAAVLQGLPILLDRSLIYPRGPSYAVPAVTTAALRTVCQNVADAKLGELVSRWISRGSTPTRTDSEILAFGEIGAALTSICRKDEQWTLCRRLAADEMLELLNARGLWKEYTVVLRSGIDAAEHDDRRDWVRLSCQLARKLVEMGEEDAARAVFDGASTGVSRDSVEEAWILSHRAIFREPNDADGALDDLMHSLRIHRNLGRRRDRVEDTRQLPPSAP